MARSSAFSLLRSALLGATVLALFQPALVQARVGVTSATDGDPKGKPPSEPERVLRIGIDVQANEVVTTGANDRAHLVFLDGTSVTVGPNARLTIDKFVYDPATKTGDLAITASKGVFRLVGGKISKNNPITVNTPSSTIGIRGGMAMFTVTAAGTTSTFLFGTFMTMTGGGITHTALKPGFQMSSLLGKPPTPPVQATPGSLAASIASLEGSGNGGSSGGNADGGAAGFGATNSGGGTGGGTPPPPSGGNTPNTTNVVSNTNIASTPTTPTQPVTTVPRTTQVVTGFYAGIAQELGPQFNFLGTRTHASGAPSELLIATNATTNLVTAGIQVKDVGQGATVFVSTGGVGLSSFTNDQKYTTTAQPTLGTLALNTVPPSTALVFTEAAITSSGASATPIYPPGTTPCECAFLTWGNLDVAVAYPVNFRNGGVDVINTTYVAGTLSTVGALNAANLQNSVATYNGSMVGRVQFGSNAYVAGGIYTNVWSFGTQSGVVTGSFDGLAYSGTAALINNGPGFSGTLAVPGLASTTSAGINGAFYASTSSPLAGQAGNFAINGTRVPTTGGAPLSYQAAGTFAAQK